MAEELFSGEYWAALEVMLRAELIPSANMSCLFSPALLLGTGGDVMGAAALREPQLGWWLVGDGNGWGWGVGVDWGLGVGVRWGRGYSGTSDRGHSE